MPNPFIIGITGTFGSGKTTAASYFESLGYEKLTLSSFLELEAQRRGSKKITRKLLQDIGNEWRKEYGKGVLAKIAVESIKDAKNKKFVIDGIRNTGEIDVLKAESEFVLVGVIADRPVRFERLKKLKRREELTPEVFYKLDCRDLGIGQDETGLQVAYCFSLSDYFIENNETKKVFDQKLAKLHGKIKKN